MTQEHEDSLFWDDLARDLEDPEFAEAFLVALAEMGETA